MNIIVVVKTNQKENKIIKENDYYKVYLKSKPLKGKANKELIKLLEEYFNKKAAIKSGKTSRKKLVEIK